ncbi:MAG: hypothetical protein M9934_07155 [Thermomicrobiales bacterium]|nr:hypothetical protein [Thermomicrobiales bacterium]MCO5218687.1 hypothetical protein [Thermomicrobiales bacterium]MCO5228048.1 hypothetical protein [Thermomicrobiales bacterium]
MDTKQSRTTQNTFDMETVLDGFETIRMVININMLNRDLVRLLARELDYDQTAEWIESVSADTYAELIQNELTVAPGGQQLQMNR